jgi:superfamily II DNA/RNA helicase
LSRRHRDASRLYEKGERPEHTQDFLAAYKASMAKIPRRRNPATEHLVDVLSDLVPQTRALAEEEEDIDDTLHLGKQQQQQEEEEGDRNMGLKMGAEGSSVQSFSGLGIHQSLCARLALRQPPLYTPNHVQREAFKGLLQRNAGSMTIQAPTGQGKTLAYVLPILTMLGKRTSQWLRDRPGERVPVMGVIVLPTRELCAQVMEEINSLVVNNPAFVGGFLDDAEMYSNMRRFARKVAPGESLRKQARQLAEAPPVLLVGTSQRLNELFNPLEEQPKVRRHRERADGPPLTREDRALLPALDHVSVACLDEADNILKPLGKFATDKIKSNRVRHPKPGKMFLDRLLVECRRRGQHTSVVYVSATMNNALRGELRVLAKDHKEALAALSPSSSRVADVVNVKGNHVELVPPKLQHRFSVLPDSYDGYENKDDYIAAKCMRVIDVFERPEYEMKCALVVIDSDHRMMDYIMALQRHMSDGRHGVAVMHEFLARSFRERGELISGIEHGAIQFILTTEDSARGLHLPGVDAVFVLSRFSLGNAGTYQHLAGRAAREEKVPTGHVFSIVTPREQRLMTGLKTFLQIQIAKIE